MFYFNLISAIICKFFMLLAAISFTNYNYNINDCLIVVFIVFILPTWRIFVTHSLFVFALKKDFLRKKFSFVSDNVGTTPVLASSNGRSLLLRMRRSAFSAFCFVVAAASWSSWVEILGLTLLCLLTQTTLHSNLNALNSKCTMLQV